MLTAGAGASLGVWLAGGVVAAGAAAAAAGGLFGGENPQALVRTGMQKFRQVRTSYVTASVAARPGVDSTALQGTHT